MREIEQMDYKTVAIEYESALNNIAYLIDSASYALQDLQERYFERYDRRSDETDIVWEFNRNRARTAALSVLMGQIQRALDEAGVSR